MRKNLSKIYKVSDEKFIEIASSSLSIRSAIIGMGISETGSAYKTFRNRAEILGVDLSHMTGQLWNKGKSFGPKYSLDDYLSNKRFISSHHLKLRLIKEGIKKYYCEWCKISEWRGERIGLELDHIDGNYRNNSLDNLRILCPNCHSQTDNFRGRNKNKPHGPVGPSKKQINGRYGT